MDTVVMVATGDTLDMDGVIPATGDLVTDGDIPDTGAVVIMDTITILTVTEEEVLRLIMEEEIIPQTEAMPQTEATMTEISQTEIIPTEAIQTETAITQTEEVNILILEEVLL